MTKDYYKILDITEFSTLEEIKCAYRKLARKWHPDIAGNNPDALLRFKEINEAYEILSDKVRKNDYDTARKFYEYASGRKKEGFKKTETPPKKENQETYNNPAKEPKKNFGFNWEEFIAKKHRDNQYKKGVKPAKRGEDIYSDVEITIFEAVNGTTKIINMLQSSVCKKCNGRKFVNGSTCVHCDGKGEKTDYKRFTVKIPAGIKNGSKIRLAEEGGKGLNGGKNGDLYLTIHIRQAENYKTEGLNILKNIQIAPQDAVLGCEINVSTPQGNVLVKIAKQTKNGQKIRLAGCGLEQNKKFGDMIITIEIQIPQSLTDEEISLYKMLQNLSAKKLDF